MKKDRLLLILGLVILPITLLGQTSARKSTRFDSIQIKAEHPRIWLDSAKIVWLKEKCKGKTSEEVLKLAGSSIIGRALTYVITGDEKIGREAITLALGKPLIAGERGMKPALADQAICYDWCHQLFSVEDKKTLFEDAIRQSTKLMNSKRNWRSFHNGLYSTAWPLTAATLAFYGDDPFFEKSWNFLKPELEDVLRVHEKLFYDGEWAEGFDYNRHSTYLSLRIFMAFKTATGKNFIINSPHYYNTGKYILYATKPNGLVLPSDDNDWPYLGGWEYYSLLILNAEYRDSCYQYFLNHCPVERFKLDPKEQYAHLFWYDPTIPEKPLTDLPLSRIFRGRGYVISRSGWDWDTDKGRSADTWLAFHCGDYFGDHCHYDINSFQIYHKGELAIDSGRYDDDWDSYEEPEKTAQSQFFNYYQRTIAHNSILVFDPNEKWEFNVLNDGGQLRLLTKDGNRSVPEDYEQGNYPSNLGAGVSDWAINQGKWETGDIISYKATKDYMYVCGDGTKAYSPNKLKLFVRQLFFMQPNLLVVFDHVVSTKPELKKTWLLHSINEPQIAKDNSFWEFTYGDGRLVCVPVLPRNLQVTKVGGTGDEFLVSGAHLKCGLQSPVNPSELHYGEIPGAWRVEESPSQAATEDYFLNVIMVGDKGSKDVLKVKVLKDDLKEIVIEVKADKFLTLKFNKVDKPAASIIKVKGAGKVWQEEKMPNKIILEQGREK